MKKINKILIFICVFFIISAPIFTFATTLPGERLLPRLVDDAFLLSDDEAEMLLEKLNEISIQEQLDVVVVTVESLEGKTPTEYADDFFDYNGYGIGDGYDGILLLISIEDRDLAISTHGYAITVFTDYIQESMMDQLMEDLGSGNYSGAFNTFADLCQEYIIQSKTSDTGNYTDNYNNNNNDLPDTAPYSPNNSNGQKTIYNSSVLAVVSILIGAITAFIITGGMKRKLKSVHMQSAASAYIMNNSLKINDSRDTFMYSRISKVKIEKPKSSSSGSSRSSGGSRTHTSSSGRTHGGSSRKF